MSLQEHAHTLTSGRVALGEAAVEVRGKIEHVQAQLEWVGEYQRQLCVRGGPSQSLSWSLRCCYCSRCFSYCLLLVLLFALVVFFFCC